MTRVVDLVGLAAGLVLLVVSGFFLVVEDPDVSDVWHVLAPATLLVAGATLVVGSLRKG